MKIITLLLVTLTLILGSCASAPTASADKDSEVKRFSVAAGSGNLYIVRKQEGTGSLMSFTVNVDGKSLGAVREGQFLVASLEPGQHQLRVDAPANIATTTVTIPTGKNVFWQIANSGSTTQAALSLILIEEMGKLVVMQSRLAAGTP